MSGGRVFLSALGASRRVPTSSLGFGLYPRKYALYHLYDRSRIRDSSIPKEDSIDNTLYQSKTCISQQHYSPASLVRTNMGSARVRGCKQELYDLWKRDHRRRCAAIAHYRHVFQGIFPYILYSPSRGARSIWLRREISFVCP